MFRFPHKLPALAIATLLLTASLNSAPLISEFMAANDTTLVDVDGDYSDWIEIHNPGASALSLAGYHLTDDIALPTKWTFPAVSIAAGGHVVVFASNKDRTDPANQLHTNFKLSSGGEYLALVAADGVTVISAFAPAYPPQFPDESFGLGTPGSNAQISLTPAWSFPSNYANVQISGQQTATLTASADSLDASFNSNQLQYYMWFDLSSRLGLIAPGDIITSATVNWSGAVGSSIFGSTAVDSELGIFPLPDTNYGIDSVAATFSSSVLPNYYAANTPISSFTAVPGQTPIATWDIKTLVEDWRDNPGAAQRGEFMIINSAKPMHMDWDQTGGLPALTATVNLTSDPNAPPPEVYFDSPTPGATNAGGQLAGPVFGTVTEEPPQPVSGALTLTAEIAGSANAVASVTAYYRLAFGAESSLTMNDDGTAPDAIAGDNIYSTSLPAASIQPGEMTRWRFEAIDSGGALTKQPPFRDPLDSHEYFGTVGHDPDIETNLTVVHWFVQNPTAANNTTGTRGSVYYLGQFYDNVHFNRHGQSTGGFIKKSYNLDFNKTQRFQWSPDAPRTADIDLLTNWADKSKVRHPIAWEIMRESGVHGHFAFTVRVEQNGQFFSTADFVEDGDDIFLERAGLNKDGALYKVYSNRLNKDQGNTGYAGVEKKNRKSENNDDLQALIDGLDLTGTALDAYMRDNIDIPKCVNLLAANSVIRNIDMHSKNWYIYRDTGKTDEWAMLPWDLDLSGGRVWNSANTYFDNNIYTSGFVVTGNSIRLVSHLFGNPDTRSMIMRRIRTLSDEFLQPESTPLADRWYERRLDEQAALIDDPAMTKSDAQRDFEKWGSWLQGNGASVPYTNNDPAVESMAEAIVRWKTEYLPGRRNEIYNSQTVGNGGEIPLPQTDANTVSVTKLIEAGDNGSALIPTSGALGSSWQGAPANEPFSTASWISGPTGFGYENSNGYQSMIGTDVGTQMASNASVYIRIPFTITDPSIYDSLELRMQADDGFVAYLNGTQIAIDNSPANPGWNATALGNGTEVNPASYDIYNVTGSIGLLQTGQNILAIHGLNQSTGSSDFIIRPELVAGTTIIGASGEPILEFGAIEFSPASGNQDEEYVEVTNPFSIAVDVSEWQITGGIEHTFHPGTVIPAGGSLFISPDVNTFRARTTSPTGGESRFIQGEYSGHLSSFGETLDLVDANANLVNSITYIGDPSDAQLNLVISEIMYHPDGDGLAEFIELTNISSTLTLDLTGVKFVNGVDFDFTGSAVTSLAPGARVLIVRDLPAFEAIHGTGLPVAGVFANTSRLNNDGETLKLEDSLNGTIQELTYNDAAPWPTDADSGYSLVLIDPGVNPDHDTASHWRSSALPGGTPGGSDTVSPPASPLDDDDCNGWANIVDHAMGNDLGLPPIAPTFTMAPMPTITYTISIGAETVTPFIELSQDMDTWTSNAADTSIISTRSLGDGRALVTAQVNGPLANAGHLFYRVSVTQ